MKIGLLREHDADLDPSSSAAAASSNLQDRRLLSHGTQTELNTLQLDTLHGSDWEEEAEEFAMALIHESNPFWYLWSLFKSWWEVESPRLSRHGFLKPQGHVAPSSLSVDTSEDTASSQFSMSWSAVCSIIFLKCLLLIAKPFQAFGNTLEYYLNLIYINHGLGKTLYTCLFNRAALKRPWDQGDDYYCVLGLVDPRQALRVEEGIFDDVSNLNTEAGMKSMADVCIMASKIAYENENVIKKAVEQKWKMNFVEFFDCWNDYLECKSTQAFLFTDKKQDASIVVVAFRGTQPFNMYDWCTDFDFSYYMLPEMGRVHVGFLEALGLGSRLRRETLKQAKANTISKAKKKMPKSTPTSGLSKQVINDDNKVLAYDAISAKIEALLEQNPKARLYITGHSLGGALATLFSALLLIEDNVLCLRLGGVFTFGQPRVGDAKFACYMEQKLCGSSSKKYFRIVFRTDIVPRVPFDDVVFQFKHISPCHYYLSPLESKALLEEPYKGLMTIMLLPMPHFYALKEVYQWLKRRLLRRGEGSTETGLGVALRFCATLCPGLCAHFPTYYVDAVRGAPSSFLLQAVSLETSWKTWTFSLVRSLKWPKIWSTPSTAKKHLG